MELRDAYAASTPCNESCQYGGDSSKFLTIRHCALNGGQRALGGLDVWVDLILDLGSESNKVDRPVDPRGGSTSCPELICRRQQESGRLHTVAEEKRWGSHQRESGARHSMSSAATKSTGR